MTDIPSEINGLAIRAKLGRDRFHAPEPWGNGWRLHSHRPPTTIIVTTDDWVPGEHTWLHASISHPTEMPSYEEMKALHAVVFGDRWAYMPFAPTAEHVNDHEFCLHLYGRSDGANVLPDFTHGLGTI
jgi:hypothetical protein